MPKSGRQKKFLTTFPWFFLFRVYHFSGRRSAIIRERANARNDASKGGKFVAGEYTMNDPTVRADLSRFVVHLTREYDGKPPLYNLRRILNTRTIEARSVNCLYGPLLEKMRLTSVLQSKFKSVCFSEAPLTQIHRLADPTLKRLIKLAPYGIVFQQEFLLDRGGGSAYYLNAMYDTEIRDMLLADFRKLFGARKSYKEFSEKHEDADARIRYFAMQNVRRPYHDFSWEREWRHVGDLKFHYDDVVAVICPEPFRLKQAARKMGNNKLLKAWDSLAFIDINACVDEWVERLSNTIKRNASAKRVKGLA